MTNEHLSATPAMLVDFQATFNALPGCFMLLKPNAPDYTILGISDELLSITQQQRAKVIGKNIFEIFPENPTATSANGPADLRISLQNVIQTKEPDQMSVVRYDVLTPEGNFEDRFWSPSNKPVLNEKGEVIYIIHSTVEVTGQFKLEKKQLALKKIENAYDLFMQAPMAVCMVTGPENIVELVNKEMLQLLARTPDMLGKPFFDVLPEIIDQGFPELLDQVRNTGKPFYATEHTVTLLINGKVDTGYYNYIYQPYFTDAADKKPSGVFIVAHRVTEQVLARKKVEQVKDYLNFRNALFEAQNEVTPDGVLVVDAKGKMLLHNKLFVDIWKIPPRIIESKDDAAALQHAKTLLADPEGYLERVNTLYEQQKESAFDEILFKDGRVIERYGKPIVAENGFYYGWAWYFRDITDRVRQEQKFRNVVEQAADPILILKGEDLILEVANQALLDLWQVDATALHQPFLSILPEMKEQGVDQLLLGVMHSGEVFYGYELPFVFKRKNGIEETRYFNFNYLPYREADGRITGVLVMASDVTDQVAGKQRLADSEARFKNLVLSAPIAIAVFRGDDLVAEIVNDAYLPLVGKTRAEFVGKPLFESLPEAREVLEPLARELMRTGKPFPASEFEIVLNRNGQPETCYFNSVWQPLYEPDGRINGFIAVAHEITEQVIARKKVEESEQQVRSFVQSAPMPIGVYVGKEMRILFANQAMVNAWGKGNDVFGKPFSEVMPEMSSQDVFKQLDDVFTTGNPFHSKYQEFTLERNGEWQTVYYNYSLTPLYDTNGNIYGVMNTAADVTDLAVANKKIAAFAAELKVSEERFRIMADAAPNLVWALHPDSSVRYVNKTFLEFLGVSLEKFVAENWVPYMYPEDLALTQQMITDAIRKNEIIAMEHRMRRHDGTYRWLLSQGAPSYYPNGELYGYVGSAIDITELKLAEEALAAKNEQLTRINNDLDNFVYAASHDLRSPITNVEALTVLLKEELIAANFLNVTTEDVLRRMIHSVDRFKRTIGDLTEISRLQQNLKAGLLEETIDISGVYEEIIADINHQNRKACHIQTDFQVAQLTFSRKNFRSILYNLISNAIKYQASSRDCNILVDTRLEDAHVVLRVKDNGLGLHKRQQEQLYTMFKRFHNHVEGSGIGLFMVKRIVENAGGKIEVTSEIGEGTEFRVYLKADR